jgi:peroxiredoxin
MSLLVFGVVLPWLIVGMGCWLGYQLVRQNGRILLRLEALEEQLTQLTEASAPISLAESTRPRGLSVGSMAPAFELPDLNGGCMALNQFQGRRVLLLFFNTSCGFCRQMAPDLAALPWDGTDERPVPLVVTTGDAEENRKLVKEYGIHCPVLLQKQMEVASLYQAGGTPMGYLIDEEGRIASEIAVGAQALLALTRLSSAATEQKGQEAVMSGNERKVYKGNRSLTNSHINRNGLPIGVRAPDFCLPRLDGGELSLKEYRGRRVLLVFSDPGCGPCNQLAPELEQWHRHSPDLNILMVSRGAPEVNQAKVAEHRLTFPVVLQRQWEISRDYGMFGTPIGYLIDEEGIIAADVAVGMEPILRLVSGAATSAHRKERVLMH